MRRQGFSAAIARCGQTVRCVRDGQQEAAFKGVIKPRGGHSEPDSPLGYELAQEVTLYAVQDAASEKITAGEYLQADGRLFFVRRVWERRLGEEIVYREMLLSAAEVGA
jgi:hypothetical protein